MTNFRIVCCADGCRIERRWGLWPFLWWVPHEPYSYMGHVYETTFPDPDSAIRYLMEQDDENA